MNNIQDIILSKASIERVLKMMESDLKTNPMVHQAPFGTNELLQRLDDIQQDYDRIAHFMSMGYDDKERDSLCQKILDRCYSLAGDIFLCHLSGINASISRAANVARLSDNDPEMLRIKLENFTQDVAMIEFLNDRNSSEHRRQVYAEHARLADNLFSMIVVSPSWTESKASHFGDILLSPTIDSSDAQLLVSALMMSLLTVFDEQKWLLLVRIWREASSITLSERAFVGWVLTYPDHKIDSDYGALQRVRDTLINILDSDDARRELLEMQMQIFQCYSADEDGRKLQEEIMPTLVKHSGMVVKDGILQEREDDPMDDILPHSDVADEVEKSFQRLSDLQSSGADLYFHGLQRMKNYPFFSTLSNWFLPFYTDHPDLEEIPPVAKKIIKIMSAGQQICESDKYSLALTFKHTSLRIAKSIDSLPENFSESVAKFHPTSRTIERRLYLQDLYRFFTICPAHTDFINPFAAGRRAFFFALGGFPNELLLAESEQLVTFFFKRKLWNEIVTIYQSLNTYCPDIVCQLAATALQQIGQYDEAFELSSKLLTKTPDVYFLVACRAASAKHLERWNDAVESYNKLIEIHPDNLNVSLSLAMCLLKINHISESLAILQRLRYEHSDNMQVVALLMEANLIEGNNEEVVSIATAVTVPTEIKLLNDTTIQVLKHIAIRCTYALMLLGNITVAKQVINTTLHQLFNGDANALEQVFRDDESVQKNIGLSQYSLDLLLKVVS